MTPFRRTQIVTTNIPLPRGLARDGAVPGLTALSAYLGVNVAVQVMKPARNSRGEASVPLYPDGSWRVARVAFPVEMPAATGGQYGYDWWTERDITISDLESPLPSFTIHPDLDLAKLGFRWECGMFDPETATSGVVRQVEFEATKGRITEFRSPYAVTEPAAVEEWDTAQVPLVQGWLHAYRVSGRIMPEEFGGGPEEPTTYATIMYEVPNGALDGCGRQMRWWIECGHGLVTRDEEARDYDGFGHGEFVAGGRPWFTFRKLGAGVNWAAQCDMGDTVTLRQENFSQTARVSPLNPFDPGSRAQYLAINSARVMRGVLLARGEDDGYTSLDLTSWSAVQHGNGEQAIMEGMSLDWRERQENYGPYGVATRWDDYGFADEDRMRTLQAGIVRRNFDRYKRAAYDPFPIHSNFMAASQSGNHPNFSAFGCQQYVACSHPDFRDMWISQTVDAYRTQTWRTVGCEPVNFRHDFPSGSRPESLYSGFILGDGEPVPQLALGASGRPDYGLQGGKRWQSQFGVRLSRTPSGALSGNGYSDIDTQHVDFGHSYALTTLTGDRWMVGRRVLDMIQHSLNHKQVSPTDTGGFSPSNATAHGLGNPRSEGRVARCRAQAFWWTWDEDVAAEVDKRVRAAWRYHLNGNPEGFFQGGLDRTAAHLVTDSGYWNIGAANCDDPAFSQNPPGRGELVWDNGSSSAANIQNYAPFQQGINAEGMYLSWRVLEGHGGYPTSEALGKDIAGRLCKGVALMSWREMPDDSRRVYFAVHVGFSNYEPITPAQAQFSQQFCDVRNGSLLRTDWWGELIPDVGGGTAPNAGVPRWRFPRSDFVPYVSGPLMLASLYLLPDDPEIEAKVQEVFVDRRPWNLEVIRSRIGNYSGSYFELLAPVVPQALTRWDNATGPRTYDETIEIDLDPGATAAAAVTFQESATSDFELGATASDGQDLVYDETAVSDFAFGVAASESVARLYEETATAGDVLGADVSETFSRVYLETIDSDLGFDASAVEVVQVPIVPLLLDETIDVDTDFGVSVADPSMLHDETIALDTDLGVRLWEAVERSMVEQVAAVDDGDDDGTQTLDEQIGRSRRRALRVRLYRDAYGDPRRVTSPGPWRGPEPVRRTYHPEAELDDA